jgi:DNA polymerase-4
MDEHLCDTPEDSREPWLGRAVLHVDMDAFFTSVEQLDHPEWRGKPVVVGGSPTRRGVIAAASYEARRYGVRSAMPAARAVHLLPADAIWARGNFARYAEVSDSVFEVFASFSPDVQGASIDEAYLDVTPGSHGEHPVSIACRIKSAVDAMGLSCSIGVASGKTVAKIASDHDKPHGITVIPPGTEAAFLAPLGIEVMPGIGPATATRLRTLGIRTLGELAGLDQPTAEAVFGSHGASAVRRAQGIDSRPVRERDGVKSVSNERTFGEDLRDADKVREVLGGLAEHVAVRLRRKGLRGRTIHLKLRFGDFTTKTAQETLPLPTDSTAGVTAAAMRLLQAQWAPGVGVRLLGIGVSGFGEVTRQLDLLESEQEAPAGRRSVDSALDAVRARFGEDAVRLGGRRSISRDAKERYGPDDEKE